MKKYLFILLAILSIITPVKAEESTDSLPTRLTLLDKSVKNTNNTPPTASTSNRKGNKDENSKNWWTLFKKGKLNLADTTVEYPKFLGFCVKVYNWGDRVFNSYDTTYVVGTGKRWKARLASDNWLDSYYLNLDRKMPIRMMSDMYFNAGIYVQYMAVSVGRSLDLSNVIGNRAANHNKMEYNFNCARFNISAHYWENTGGTIIRTFGKYNDGHLIKMEFPAVTSKTLGIDGYYFFNNRKYSMGAAYNFSKIQKRSAGSAIIGFNLNNLDIAMDMHFLPDELKPYLTLSPRYYKFHYNTYALMGGYCYNWVWNKHFLFNITAAPGLGYTHTYEDSVERTKQIFSAIIKGQSSITYNNGNFFVCGITKIDGNWYKSNELSFFSSIENFQLSAGVRF